MLLSDFLTDSIAWSPEVDDRLLIAGDEHSIAAIETLLATLPIKARGQVFIEVGCELDVFELSAPGRIVICWLVRDRGQNLRRSVDAWLSEMLPVDVDREYSIYSWIVADGPARLLTSN